MKIIGMMCVKDEADLLPQVFPHVRELVDLLYVYEDGSTDDTWSIVREADFAVRRQDDTKRELRPRGNYHYLLEKIRKDFPKEEVWVVIAMGDRFYLNKTPRQIIAEAGDYDAVEGVQLDFLRHRMAPWTPENDTFPDYRQIRHICRWFKYDERCIVAYKLTPEVSYASARYPWPRGIKSTQYKYRDMGGNISLDMPYLEHQGRRSPKAAMYRYTSGSRILSKKYEYDLSSFDTTVATIERFYSNYKLLPWIDAFSLKEFVQIRNDRRYWGNEGKPSLRELFRKKEAYWLLHPPEPRKDITF